MATETIPRNRWREFLTGFTRAHQGWLVTVELLATGNAPATLMRNVPLRGVTDDGDQVVIMAAADTGRAEHIIDAPVNVRVDRLPNGVDRALEIETRDATLVRVRFRSDVAPELVDGLLNPVV
jgi:hypothetical protein